MLVQEEVKNDSDAESPNISKQRLFCGLSAGVLRAIEAMQYSTLYPAGAMLFVEGQAAHGIYILRRGRIKLSICARDGKTLILRLIEAGEVLGLSAAVSGRAFEGTAETQEVCEISFIRMPDFHRLMRAETELVLRIAEHLSEEYNSTCQEIRSLMLSESAGEKLARLLLGWLDKNGEPSRPGYMKLGLTHEEIAQMIGTSRETVTRLLSEFKKRQLIQQKGSTVLIRNRVGLEALLAA
jgi:CRP/FNR family cyclic AMP-dependent transcriptional regulator